MSTRGAITWGRIVEICKKRGIEISFRDSERKLKGRGADGQNRVMRIGHKCCRSHNTVVWTDYVKAFQRLFAVSNEELYDE